MTEGADCVLLDLSLPDASRLEAPMQLRAAAPDVPIVILSGLQDELLAIKAVQEGAQDYLVKGRVDGAAIGRSITYAAERKALEMQMAHKAMHDALTELPNRTLFQDRLKHAVMRAKRHESLLGVMFIDLDGFKPINDGLGHDVGDLLLKALGRRLQEGLRASDTAARFGGDEFMVLCEDVADEQHVISIAERLQGAIAEPFMIDGHELSVSSSMGIVVSSGHDESAESLVRNADAAMYRAKRQGVAYEVFDDGMRSRVRARARTESDLHRAIEEREFRLLYQPQVDLRSGQIVGPRGAAALGPSRARRGRAGRVPVARGGDRPDHQDRRVGAAPVLPAGAGLGRAQRIAAAGVGQPVSAPAPRPGPGRSGGAHPDRDAHGSRVAVPRDHRERGGQRRGQRRRHAAGAEGAGREAVDRRVRHRPLLAGIAEALPARHAEGGQLVRQPAWAPIPRTPRS